MLGINRCRVTMNCMTFCIALRVADGVVALADTRIVRGSSVSNKFKISNLPVDDGAAVVMTSGLRSVRDKAIARLEDGIVEGRVRADRLHELASALGDELKRVRVEDGASLAGSGLSFNVNGILAGRLNNDPEPEVIHLYPEGNWVSVAPEAPYVIIGRSYYGKPILDRLLHFDTPLGDALSLAYLAFDATRASVTDVDFPIDVGVLGNGDDQFRRARFEGEDLAAAHSWWTHQLATAVRTLPSDWADVLWQAPAEPSPTNSTETITP